MASSASITPTPLLPRRQIHLWHFFVLIALLASVLAVSVQLDLLVGGFLGISALSIVAGWLRRSWWLATLPPATLILFALLLPQTLDNPPRRRSMTMTTANNLRHLALALQNYHDQYGAFPPAVIKDQNGRPLYSWRVLLLPHLERNDLYQAFHLDEPWNSPYNAALIPMMPREFQDPLRAKEVPRSYLTTFVAIVGDETLWPADQSVTLANVNDGASNTLALVEWPESDIVWTEPRDLPMQEAKKWWFAPGAKEARRRERNVWVSWADGHVSLLHPRMLTGPELRSMLTRAGGE